MIGHLQYLGIRCATSLPLLAGPKVSIRAARQAGRAFGQSRLSRKRLDQAIDRLEIAFPGMDPDRRREVVLSSYEHLFMLGAEIVFSSRLLTEAGWPTRVEVRNAGVACRAMVDDRPTILITGHCGNWEVLGYTMALLGFPMHALYRPLDLKPLDNWVRRARERRGLRLVDKFGAVRQLPGILDAGESVAFVADQNAGDRGLHVPFFNRLASTYKSIGILAIKQRATIAIGVARRLGPEATSDAGRFGEDAYRYRIEVDDVFRYEDYADQPDPMFYLTARYRRSIERMVRQSPEQYLWMHRIWKSRPRHERLDRPFPKALREKLEALPWMTSDDVERLVDRSDRDRAWMAERGVDRLP